MREWSPAAQTGTLKWSETVTKEKSPVQEVEMWAVSKGTRNLQLLIIGIWRRLLAWRLSLTFALHFANLVLRSPMRLRGGITGIRRRFVLVARPIRDSLFILWNAAIAVARVSERDTLATLASVFCCDDVLFLRHGGASVHF
jgi:hypothetical protein